MFCQPIQIGQQKPYSLKRSNREDIIVWKAYLPCLLGLPRTCLPATQKIPKNTSSSHIRSGIVPLYRVGRISYGHCLYHASPVCLITCILFHQSIFLHLILYLLFPRLFRSSSSFTTVHFKFQSLHYHILIVFPQNMTVLIA